MRIVALKDVADVTMGTAPPGSSYNTDGNGIPMIAGAGDYGSIHPEPQKWTTAATRIAEVGDIIVCVRATIGDLNWADKQYCLGRGVAGIRPHSDKLDSRYVARFIDSKKDDLTRLGTGSTFPAIRRGDLEGFPIPLPPLAEQKRIAGILDAADALRAKRRESIAQLDALVQSTFLDMFGDPVTNPKGWSIGKIGSHATKIGSGATPTGGRDAYKTTGIALIRSMNVRDGLFLWDDLARLDDKQASKLGNVVVEADDILLNITGASVARVCRAPREVLPARVNQHVCIIRTASTLEPKYLENLLLSVSMKHKLLGIGESGATRQAITKAQVIDLDIPLPPLGVQKRYTIIIESIDQQKTTYRAHLAELDTLFASLQTRAFRGEL